MVLSARFIVPSASFEKHTFPEFTTRHNGQELIWEVSVKSSHGSYAWEMALKSPENVEIVITNGYISGYEPRRLLEGMKFETGNKVHLCSFSNYVDSVWFYILEVRQLVSLKRKRDLALSGSKLLEKVMRGDPDPDFDGSIRLISADGDTFYGHKAILAGLEYFERNFVNKTKDVMEGKIRFKDIRSSTLQKILSLAYTGEYGQVKEYDFEEIKGLFHAFDKFMLKEESDELQKVVKKLLRPENVGEILVMADVYNLVDLKAEALKVAVRNVDHLFGPIWKEIYKRQNLVKEILKDFAGKARVPRYLMSI